MRTTSNVIMDIKKVQKSLNSLVLESKSFLDEEDEANLYLDDFYEGFNYGIGRLIVHLGGFSPSENKQ